MKLSILLFIQLVIICFCYKLNILPSWNTLKAGTSTTSLFPMKKLSRTLLRYSTSGPFPHFAISPSSRSFSTSTKRTKQSDTTSPYVISLTRDSLPEETIFIIDGTSLIFKSYFSEEKNKLYTHSKLTKTISEKLLKELPSLNELQSVDEQQDNNASESKVNEIKMSANNEIMCAYLVMFANQFVSLIDFIAPKYVVVVFDAGAKTFRDDLYKEYKQHREKVYSIIS